MKVVGIIVFILGSLINVSAMALSESNNPMEYLLGKYLSWASHVDELGLQKGEPLSALDIKLAAEIGIAFPEKVRVVYVDSIPYPYEDAELREMGETLGFIGAGVINNAQVFGYSIYVRNGYDLNRSRLAHELVHVLQIERSSFAEILTQHVKDLAQFGYELAPLEVEAFKANLKYAVQ